MESLDRALDVVAFLYALVFFPAPVFWLIIHSAIAYWRRIGSRAYGVALPVWIIPGAALFALRDHVFAQRIHRTVLTWVVGTALVALGMWLGGQVRRQFSLRRLIGLLELHPQGDRGPVIRTGIYAHVRHPRYLEFMVTFAGLGLLTGAEGIFALAIVTVLMYLIVAPLEERELRDYYGAEYEAYAREVPRFLPRMRRATKPPIPSGMGGYHA